MDSHRKRDNRDLDEEEDYEHVNVRASDDVLKTRKIRKPNYRKGMTSTNNDDSRVVFNANKAAVFPSTELQATSSNSESLSDLHVKKSKTGAGEELGVFSTARTETPIGDITTSPLTEDGTSEKGDSETDASVTVKPCDSRNPSTTTLKPGVRGIPSIPNQPSGAKNAFEAVKNEESKKSEISAVQTTTNPFANILNDSKLGLFKLDSDQGGTLWNSEVSFVALAKDSHRDTSAPAANGEDESPETLEEEEIADHSTERSVGDDEVIISRCHAKAYRLDPENKTWRELGPGILKLTVHKDLHEDKEDLAPETNFGRLLFHDTRNRINRMNFSLGESLKVSDGSKGKNLIFTTAIDTTDASNSRDCQTYLVKEVAGPSVHPTSGMPEFRELIEKYNAKIARNIESKSLECKT